MKALQLKKGGQADMIIDVIEQFNKDGVEPTSSQVTSRLKDKMKPSSIRGRIGELKKRGVIKNTNQKKTPFDHSRYKLDESVELIR